MDIKKFRKIKVGHGTKKIGKHWPRAILLPFTVHCCLFVRSFASEKNHAILVITTLKMPPKHFYINIF